MVFFNKYLFEVSFFSFHAVASLDYISLQAGLVRPGMEGQGQFDYFFAGGGGSEQI